LQKWLDLVCDYDVQVSSRCKVCERVHRIKCDGRAVEWVAGPGRVVERDDEVLESEMQQLRSFVRDCVFGVHRRCRLARVAQAVAEWMHHDIYVPDLYSNSENSRHYCLLLLQREVWSLSLS